jgi:hypothetical protein
MNPFPAFVFFSALLASCRVTHVTSSSDAATAPDGDSDGDVSPTGTAETTSINSSSPNNSSSSHFVTGISDHSSVPYELNDLDFEEPDGSDLDFVEDTVANDGDGHLQHLVNDEVDEIDAKDKISSQNFSSLPVTNGQKVPAPISPPPSKFSTWNRTQEEEKDNKFRVQKCCPLGQVALAPMIQQATPGPTEDEGRFSCVERPDSLDPDWDWLGSVRRVGEGGSAGREPDDKQGGDGGVEEQLWKSYEEVYPLPKLDSTFGVPNCQHYR